MEYEWSENKRQTNIEKHGWDFADARKAWESGAPVHEEYSERKGEERWLAIGKVDTRTVAIVYEEVAEDRKRIISMRNTTVEERHEYERALLRETGREDALFNRLDKERLAREEREPEVNGNVKQLIFGDPERRLKERQHEQRDREKRDREDRER